MLSVAQLRERVLPILQRAGFDTASKENEWLDRMIAICQEKLRTLNDIVGQTDFFFVEPATYEEKAVKKHWQKEGARDRLEAIRAMCERTEPWSADALKRGLERLAEDAEAGLGPFIHPARLALTGKSVGPGLFELAELLGKAVCLERLARALDYVDTLT